MMGVGISTVRRGSELLSPDTAYYGTSAADCGT